MTEGLYLSRAKLSTRLAFVAAWFVACWAPLVPLAKTSIPDPHLKAGHGNDRAWKAMMPASHPSQDSLESLRDYHIPTTSTVRRGI
jgi:hypothetical protein